MSEAINTKTTKLLTTLFLSHLKDTLLELRVEEREAREGDIKIAPNS